MKVGISTYCLIQVQQYNDITFLEIMEWVKNSGADHIEITSMQGDFVEDSQFVKSVAEKVKELELPVHAYSTGINVLDEAGLQEQLALGYRHIDVAAEIGAGIVRCDLVDWSVPPDQRTIECFDRDIPKLVQEARMLADYAKKYHIILTVENHGMYVNGAERVKRLITAVDRENYRCTLDVGNVLCVDEDPLKGLEILLPVAAAIHIKDFYVRKDPLASGEGFGIITPAGKLLRGAIVGHGDIDIREILNRLGRQGYSGGLTIEFEGMEDCMRGTEISLQNIRNILKSGM